MSDAGLIWNEVTRKFESDRSGTSNPFVTETGPATLTNKTLTSPVISQPLTAYLEDGAISPTTHIAVLTSTDAGAYTLATTATDGVVITLVNATSYAHVITGTNLFWAGVTAGPFNKVTTAAFPSTAGILISYDGLWLVLSSGLGLLTVGD